MPTLEKNFETKLDDIKGNNISSSFPIQKREDKTVLLPVSQYIIVNLLGFADGKGFYNGGKKGLSLNCPLK